jgi:hypothetical protein
MTVARQVICPRCGGLLPDRAGEAHSYLVSTPGCWAAYGEVLAREYESPLLFAGCHRLTVDAYSLQHVGTLSDDRQVRSTWLHLVSLHAIFACGLPQTKATELMSRLDLSKAPALRLIAAIPDITVAGMLSARPSDHVRAATEWARVAYLQWPHHHQDAGVLLERALSRQ